MSGLDCTSFSTRYYGVVGVILPVVDRGLKALAVNGGGTRWGLVLSLSLVCGLVCGLVRGWVGLIDGHFDGRGLCGVHVMWGRVGGAWEARKSA